MQDLDDSILLAEDKQGIGASSILFGNVLRGPEQMTAPAPPDGPTGTGDSCALQRSNKSLV